ncbi:hypothetical protein SSPS47_27185 [Streptomyces sp. S4.7]|uniref:hypothetical protein n=1 Tax=Streptomyces sp. S4.7 TaxID=2705439 RepID=UPI0013984085|nr:hypothetical protein [Streptomyces sp. S4.7]QHY98795.1 hypothetical protein SSPS47_27185 [Streptomyces sp. S4.7]
MTSGPYFRRARAALFAAVCVLFAVLGHVLMSEMTIPWAAMLPAFGAVGVTGWALTGRERGFRTVLTATLAVQAVLHAWFSLAQVVLRPDSAGGSLAEQWLGHVLCRAPMAPMDGHAQHAMPGMPGTAMDSGHSAAGTASLGMLSAHLLAALLCGIWLAFGERAAFQCIRACAGWIVAPLRLPGVLPTPPDRPRVRAGSSHGTCGPRRLLLAHAITSRGPPTGTAVL